MSLSAEKNSPALIRKATCVMIAEPALKHLFTRARSDLSALQSSNRVNQDHFLPCMALKVFSSSSIVALQSVCFGLPARRASSELSMALSSTCQSLAARGLRPASAESQVSSRSLIRVLAPARSFLSTRAATSTAMFWKADRSPSFEAVAWLAATGALDAPGAVAALAASAGLEQPAARPSRAITER